MKRFLACVSLVAATTTAATSATTAPAAKHATKHAVAARVKVAPADEYFGKLKMSILGIRNTIKDVGANVDVDPTRWNGLVNKADFTEDAIHDWERKYPGDTWLAKTVFSLERMYAKLDSEDGRKRSLAAMNWLVRDFPATAYGKMGKRELASGHVGHPPSNSTAAASVPGFGNPNASGTIPSTQASNSDGGVQVPDTTSSALSKPAAKPNK